MSERAVHHGRNIKPIRKIQGVKQEALALELGEDWSQKKNWPLESKEVVDDELLGEVAKTKVSPEAIKNFDVQGAMNIIGNSYHDHAYSTVNFQCTINPLERWLESIEENKKLHERLLQAEKEKNALLEELLEKTR